MPPLPWVKLHLDILGDPKLMRAARKGARGLELLPWLIAFAQQADDDGALSVNGLPADPEDIAPLIPLSPRIRDRAVEAALNSLESLAVLTRNEHGVLRFNAWARRAGKPSDRPEAVRERVQKHRQRVAGEGVADAGNADSGGVTVTPRNALRNALDVEVEEERDIEAPPSGEAPAHAREGKPSKARPKRGPLSHFVPDTWAPSDQHRNKARELGVNLTAEADAFRLHEFAVAHSDWNRAFSKWLLRAPGFTNGNGNGHHAGAAGAGESSADRLRREAEAREQREALDAARRNALNTWGLEVEKRLAAARAEVRERIERAAEHEVGGMRMPESGRQRALRAARLKLYGAEIGRPMPEVGS